MFAKPLKWKRELGGENKLIISSKGDPEFIECYRPGQEERAVRLSDGDRTGRRRVVQGVSRTKGSLKKINVKEMRRSLQSHE